MRIKYLFAVIPLFCLTESGWSRTLVLDRQFNKNLPVVYELPDDADKNQAVAYVKSIKDMFYKSGEFIDAKETKPEELRNKLQGGFVLYSVFGKESPLLRQTMQPLPFNWQENSITIGGKKFQGDRLRLIFTGKNPYSDGFCSVYAAGGNEMIININSRFHGPRSYHLFDGDKWLDEGDYDENFTIHQTTRTPVSRTENGKGRDAYWADLQRDPQNAEPNLQYGEVLADDRDCVNAIPYLEKAAGLDTHSSWIKAWALNYLGRCYFAAGDNGKSRKAFLESAQMNATQNVTKKSNWYIHLFGYDDLFKNWEIKESDHFIFHFQTPSVVPNHTSFIKEREDAIAAITSFFDNTRLPFKIHYFVWNSKADALKSVGFDLGFAVPEHGVIQTSFDNETPGHETTHIVEGCFANFAKITMFINEGIAVYLNQMHWNNLEIAKRNLQRSRPGGKVSIKDLWNDESLYSGNYPLAGAFAAHLLNWGGKEKFLSLMRHQSYKEAIKIYGPGLDSAIRDFEAKLAAPVAGTPRR